MGNKILLIDDSVTVQKIITLTFSDEGVEVVTIDNGADAINRLQYMRPALVMADVSIPGKNGYDVCAYIKSNPELMHIPVILLIPGFETYDAERARRVGADHHLTKPFQSIRSLIATVKSLIDGDRPLTGPAMVKPELKRGEGPAGLRSGVAGELEPDDESPEIADKQELSAELPHEFDEVLDLDGLYSEPESVETEAEIRTAAPTDETDETGETDEEFPVSFQSHSEALFSSRDISPEVIDDIVERVAQRVVALLGDEITIRVNEAVTRVMVGELPERLATRISDEVGRSLSYGAATAEVSSSMSYDDPDQLLELDEF